MYARDPQDTTAYNITYACGLNEYVTLATEDATTYSITYAFGLNDESLCW